MGQCLSWLFGTHAKKRVELLPKPTNTNNVICSDTKTSLDVETHVVSAEVDRNKIVSFLQRVCGIDKTLIENCNCFFLCYQIQATESVLIGAIAVTIGQDGAGTSRIVWFWPMPGESNMDIDLRASITTTIKATMLVAVTNLAQAGIETLVIKMDRSLPFLGFLKAFGFCNLVSDETGHAIHYCPFSGDTSLVSVNIENVTKKIQRGEEEGEEEEEEPEVTDATAVRFRETKRHDD